MLILSLNHRLRMHISSILAFDWSFSAYLMMTSLLEMCKLYMDEILNICSGAATSFMLFSL